MDVGDSTVQVAGAGIPAWLALAELVVVAAAFAYVLGIVGARLLGSTLASFVGLTEVLFAVLFAWLLLAELPGVLQLVGGAVLLSGVVAVRLGERDLARAAGAREAAAETDLDVPSHRRLDSGGCLGEGRRTGQSCPVWPRMRSTHP